MTHEEVQQQLDAYALGALDQLSMKRIATHLSEGCKDCDDELRSWNATTGMLAFGVAPAVPSPEVKQKLLARIKTIQPLAPVAKPIAESRNVRNQTDWRGWAAAAILLVAFAGTLIYSLNLKNRETAMDERLKQQDGAIALVETRLKRQDTIVAMLSAKDTSVTSLSPASSDVTATAKVLWNANQKRWTMITDRMPDAPADKSYQLWFIVNGQKISGGVFKSADELTQKDMPAGINWRRRNRHYSGKIRRFTSA